MITTAPFRDRPPGQRFRSLRQTRGTSSAATRDALTLCSDDTDKNACWAIAGTQNMNPAASVRLTKRNGIRSDIHVSVVSQSRLAGPGQACPRL